MGQMNHVAPRAKILPLWPVDHAGVTGAHQPRHHGRGHALADSASGWPQCGVGALVVGSGNPLSCGVSSGVDG